MTLKTAPLPERGTATLWDGSLKHFGVRISKGGAKSFIVLLGSGRRQAIGRYPALSLAKAREKAKIILAQRALGKHQPGAISWKKAIEQYLDGLMPVEPVVHLQALPRHALRTRHRHRPAGT